MFNSLKFSEKILAVFLILLITVLIFVYALKIVTNPEEFRFNEGSKVAESIDNANPASQYCVQEGNKIEVVGEERYCVFSDGKKCEEWNYFRGICDE